MKKRSLVAQHVLTKEIMQLTNKGEALQNDYNRLRSTVAALTRKFGTTHLTKADLEGLIADMDTGGMKMFVTTHPEGDGLILSFGKEAQTREIVRAGKITLWAKLRAWVALRWHLLTT